MIHIYFDQRIDMVSAACGAKDAQPFGHMVSHHLLQGIRCDPARERDTYVPPYGADIRKK